MQMLRQKHSNVNEREVYNWISGIVEEREKEELEIQILRSANSEIWSISDLDALLRM